MWGRKPLTCHDTERHIHIFYSSWIIPIYEVEKKDSHASLFKRLPLQPLSLLDDVGLVYSQVRRKKNRSKP